MTPTIPQQLSHRWHPLFTWHTARWATRILAVCLALSVVIGVGNQLINATPQVIQTTENGATIWIEIARNFRWSRAECVTVTWAIGNIQAVYLNGEGTVGDGTRELCDQREVAFAIHTADDDTVQINELNIPLESVLPASQHTRWLTLAIGLWLASYGLYPLAKSAPLLAENRYQLIPRPIPTAWRTTLWALLALVVLHLAWRLWLLPFIPFTYSDDTLIPRRALELTQYPFFSVSDFLQSALGQAFQSRYGLMVHLPHTLVYTLYDTLNIPLDNVTLSTVFILYGLLKIPFFFAFSYVISHRLSQALLTALLCACFTDMVNLYMPIRGGYHWLAFDALFLFFVARWLAHHQRRDLIGGIISVLLVIETNPLFPLPIVLAGMLHLLPPPGVNRRVPCAFFRQAGWLILLPLGLLWLHLMIDQYTYELFGSAGQGILLQAGRHTGTASQPGFNETTILWLQVFSPVGGALLLGALGLALTLRIRGNGVWLMLVWMLPFVGLMFVRGGNIALYTLFLTLPAGYVMAAALLYLITRLHLSRRVYLILIGILSSSMWLGSVQAYQPQLPLVDYLRLYETSIFACYKPVGYLLRQHFPGQFVATQLGTPALYWYGEWRNNVTPEGWTVVIVRDNHVFDEPFYQLPALAAQRETEYNLQQAVSNIPELQLNFTIVDDAGKPLCHLWSDKPLPHTTLDATALSRAFDIEYGTIQELRR